MNKYENEKCEKCKEKLATISCLACGLGEKCFFCFDCDRRLHEAVYKQAHQRKMLERIFRDEEEILNEMQMVKEQMQEEQKETERVEESEEDMVSPSDYVKKFKRSHGIEDKEESECYQEDLDEKRKKIRIYKNKENIKDCKVKMD